MGIEKQKEWKDKRSVENVVELNKEST